MYFSTDYLFSHPDLFPCVIGITKTQFDKILPKFSLALLRSEGRYLARFKRLREAGGGRKAHLKSGAEKLFFVLLYYKIYPTFRFCQILFGFDKRNCQIWVRRLENVLFEALGYELNLTKAKASMRVSSWNKWIEVCPELKEFLVDATERQIQRPKDKEKQEYYYSGKKKFHTVKNQIIVNPNSKRIIAVSDTVEGKRHDKKVFEESSVYLKIPPKALALGDSAYIGIKHPFLNLVHPVKKPPGVKLSEEMKQNNKAISSIRVSVEHPISYLKHFGILAQKYRGKDITTNIQIQNIATIYNFSMTNR